MKIIKYGILVAIATTLAGLITDKIIRKLFTYKRMGKYKYKYENNVLSLTLFITGFLTHLFFELEILGLNYKKK